MRLLIVEDFTSGALPPSTPGWPSLAAEGAAMLRAIAQDAAAIPTWHPEIFWSDHLGDFSVPNVRVHHIGSPDEEAERLAELAGQVDRVLIIAPESSNRLEHRRYDVEKAGGTFIGCSADAIALCSDKLRLAGHLQAAGLPTIPTQLVSSDDPPRGPSGNGWVVKPRDGAGSLLTFHVHDAGTWRRAVSEIARTGFEAIHQPHIPGIALSIAGIVSQERIELFPLATQKIVTRQGALCYEGGSLLQLKDRTPRDRAIVQAAARLIHKTLATIPGLSGYVGVDLILPPKSTRPIVVEINPRLTTSYLGYRQLAQENLATRILDPGLGDSGLLGSQGLHPPIAWHSDRTIVFGPRSVEPAR